MSVAPFTLIEPTSAFSPLVIDSPHSGRCYPDDFTFSCPLALLKQTEDSYVDELVAGAVQHGASLIAAEFPRSYIDLNRAENDIDPAVLAEPWPSPLEPSERTLLGLGLVRRLGKSGVPVYDAGLTVAEVQGRIARCYRPYHAALDRLLAGRRRMFGAGYLVDCHSMPGRRSEPRGHQPDIVLGDLNGTSCDPAFTRLARGILQDMGYSVALNDPYKGMAILRRHGQPRIGHHALQLEINRRLYMNEETLEKTGGFAALAADMTAFFKTLGEDLLQDLSGQMAAE